MPPGRFCRVGEPLKYAMFGRGTFPVSAGRPAGRRGYRRFRRMAVPKSIFLPDVKTPQVILLRRFRFMGTLSYSSPANPIETNVSTSSSTVCQ